MLTLNDGRKELYQWDSGRTATVDIVCDVVHFANLKYGESLAVEVKGGKVFVPNKLLMSGEPIYCWAFVKDDSGTYTKKEQILNVIKRAKPSDYVYTETEVITIKTAVENAIKEAKESGEFKGEKGDTGATGPMGPQGETGATGAAGADGTSVTVSSVSESTADGGENIVTFSDGKSLTVKNGSRGSQGVQGIKGNNGTDGVSPTVEIEAITGGTKVTITDKNGVHEFNVMNGANGEPGSQGEKGDPTDVQQTTGQSTTAVMSQKAVTEEIDALKSDLAAMDYWIKQRQRFNDKPIMIAYSQTELGAWINSELNYVNNAIAGFRWIKGDVQPTSDGKLIMCHDDGFTFNADGYIGAYNSTSENTREIHDMTYEECMASKYAQEFHIRTEYGATTTKIMYRPGVCDLEKFLIVCKEYEVRPYIVIRSNYMDVVIPELLRLLEAYDFLDNCIVNSFDINSVAEVARQSNHRVMISWVKGFVQGTALTTEEVDNLLAVSPNCTINIFTSSTTAEWNNVVLADASKDAINYAKSLGVVVGTAFAEAPHLLFKRGIGLMQCRTLCVPTKVTPINLCLSLKNGVASMKRYGGYGAEYTADIIVQSKEIQLYNIRKIDSTRDFSDGITPNLSIKMPYSLTVIGSNVTGANLAWNDVILINFDTKIADLDTSSEKIIFVKFAYGI